MTGIISLKASTMIAAAFALALALVAAPVQAGHKPSHNPGGGGGGGGGESDELRFAAFLVGNLEEADLPPADPQMDSCIPGPGPTIVVAGADTELQGIDTWLDDQSFGIGPLVIHQKRDKTAAWIPFHSTDTGPGGTNPVALPGPDGDCELDPNPETGKIQIHIMFMRNQECGAAGTVPICVTGYQVWAAFDDTKQGSSGDVRASGLSIPLVSDDRTVVPMNRRFDIFQQGKKDVLYGTLSFGVLVLCPEGKISVACVAEFLP
jgi:hypothetical protein